MFPFRVFDGDVDFVDGEEVYFGYDVPQSRESFFNVEDLSYLKSVEVIELVVEECFQLFNFLLQNIEIE